MKRRKQKYDDHVIQDRLSNLPDFRLLHILSFAHTKHAVQTCILYTRWKNIWKHLPTLTLHSSSFSKHKDFTKFVSRILSRREASNALHSLDFQYFGKVDSRLLKRIVKYAVSHNVQQLRIDVRCDFQHFPTCIFSCHTLTSLNLSVKDPEISQKFVFPNSLDLPVLTSLSLESFTFCVGDDGRVEPFSKLNGLNSLIIQQCKVLGAHNLCISSATLSSLTIKAYYSDYSKVELSTPSLCTFVFDCIRDVPPLQLCGSKSNLSSVKHVNINVWSLANSTETSLNLLSWLVELTNIKSLIITSSTLEVLSLVPDLLKVEFGSLCNLKSLQLKTRIPSIIPNGALYFLLQNSPSANVEIIDRR